VNFLQKKPYGDKKSCDLFGDICQFKALVSLLGPTDGPVVFKKQLRTSIPMLNSGSRI